MERPSLSRTASRTRLSSLLRFAGSFELMDRVLKQRILGCQVVSSQQLSSPRGAKDSLGHE